MPINMNVLYHFNIDMQFLLQHSRKMWGFAWEFLTASILPASQLHLVQVLRLEFKELNVTSVLKCPDFTALAVMGNRFLSLPRVLRGKR